MTEKELRELIEAAKAVPGAAHLLLARGPSPVCSLCGGQDAPIVNGQHLNPEQFCKREAE